MDPEELVRKRVKDPGDFEWLKQCRFYWRDDKDTVIISICDRSFEYSFEYLGEILLPLSLHNCEFPSGCQQLITPPI